jgi:hypothetical protein
MLKSNRLLSQANQKTPLLEEVSASPKISSGSLRDSWKGKEKNKTKIIKL